MISLIKLLNTSILLLLLAPFGADFGVRLTGYQLNKPTRLTLLLVALINFRHKLVYYAQSLLDLLFGISPDLSKSPKIKEIYVHPVKSLRGDSVKEWEIDEHGLKCDRMYTLGIFRDGKFKAITQRECPKMALVYCDIDKENKRFNYSWDFGNGPGSFTLPMEPDVASIDSKEPVELWGVDFETFVLPDMIPSKFFEDLGMDKDTQLLYSPKGKAVRTNAPRFNNQYRFSLFQDYYPLLMVSDMDIDDLNDRIKVKGGNLVCNARNFRPNIVLEKVGKLFDTDNWCKFAVYTKDGKSHQWSVTSKCPRCPIPNINTETGVNDNKSIVSRVLSSYRRVDFGSVYDSFFGMSCVQHDYNYTISVGDAVVVKSRRINHYECIG
ncbi:BA75_02867T0 [Komagataella pastoris]|uniref:BA75_02867T0 n=1 Tax=Komagataella pastoris TaxID=4922 RepID=A0A1B2JAY6_PICPA|nr:BA75_02867T0 [Komagataella pastoris]